MGRNKSEYVEINHLNGSQVEVKIFKRDRGIGGERGDLIYHRIFNNSETKEIRLYLMGGDDNVDISGSSDSQILIRIIGGPGDDEFSNLSNGKTVVYDTKSNTKLNNTGRTVYKSGSIDSVINAHNYAPLYRSHGNLIIPWPFLFADSENGLVLGAGIQIKNYGFRKEPYASSLTFQSKYAFKTEAIQISFSSKFVDIFSKIGLKLSVKFDPFEKTYFYGYGNKSHKDSDMELLDFYHVYSKRLLVKSIFNTAPTPNTKIIFGGAFKFVDTDLQIDSPRFVIEDHPFGIDIKKSIVLNAGLTFDSRDIVKFPSKGVFCDAGFSVFPKVFDNQSSFTKSFVDCRFFLSPIRDMTFAFRCRGEKIWGTFPFYEAAYLGGSYSLRAYHSERFAGDASALGSTELRFKLFQPTIILPTDVGLYIFGEAGRVWLNGNSPGDWHTGIGGGLWFAPIYRFLTFSFGMANSTEGFRFNLNGGFAF